MLSGRRYRIGSAVGAAVLTSGALVVANARPVQEALTSHVPLVWNLQPTALTGAEFLPAMLVTMLIIGAAVAPLYKPQSRRILSIVFRAQKRILLAGLALAALGYFRFPYELPQGVLLAVVATLCVVLPLWFVAIRQVPNGERERTVVVGDDPMEIRRVYDILNSGVVGYVGPEVARADGGELVRGVETTSMSAGRRPTRELFRLGGFSRLSDVICNHEIDTVAFAFADTDRGEFFGSLETCHEYGVDVVIRGTRAESVLMSGDPGDELVDVNVEPWDWQDRMVKRAFDVAFASFGLVCLSPVILVIAAAIKAEDGGSILYGQDRTAELGETFAAYKFRSMVENAEATTGAKLSEEDAGGRDPRVTRVGYLLRKTHMDEIPQLWSILVGDMSVVGPRPERPELDGEFHAQGIKWRKRWFVKPGLTGLAQINDVTGVEPRKKLRYDIEYIRRQSLRTDVAIVIRQIWQVVVDGMAVLRGEDPEEKSAD
jgi:lipopolysaccharide/colanic/teichoic acid biosynthesis glycosyltransferase